MRFPTFDRCRLGIVGLGYVGLPLAMEFAKHFQVVGYDLNNVRIEALNNGYDETLELNGEQLSLAGTVKFTSSITDLEDCNCYIITVPTPIDDDNLPDLSPLLKASEAIGKVLKCGDIVIYESTVYPGATEENCVPILESVSQLVYNADFFVGYSPERINPGDKTRHLSDIIKVTSGSTLETADFVDELYKKIINAGTHKASSIRVAEAAKIIENVQRDVNIALVNELATIFNTLNIDTEEVLKAAETKWNFLSFRPGLVGGHCIGVDPYYLIHKAKSYDYEPQLITAGRSLNENMSSHIVGQLIKKMNDRRIEIRNSRVLIMGFTFKENCPDVRNTRVVNLVHELREYGIHVDVMDNWADADHASREYNISLIRQVNDDTYDGIVIAVAHQEFVNMDVAEIRKLGKDNHVLYDLKYVLPAEKSDLRL